MSASRTALRGLATIAAFAFALALSGGGVSTARAAAPADPPGPRQASSWGAIAARPGGGYGYAFNQASRATAERSARTQCERAVGAAGPAGACEVRAYFERSCGALAAGNFGEWSTAVAGDARAAGNAAVAQCNGLLPTEPCTLVVSVCSLP